jgi:hypothetical protein
MVTPAEKLCLREFNEGNSSFEIIHNIPQSRRGRSFPQSNIQGIKYYLIFILSVATQRRKVFCNFTLD